MALHSVTQGNTHWILFVWMLLSFPHGPSLATAFTSTPRLFQTSFRPYSKRVSSPASSLCSSEKSDSDRPELASQAVFLESIRILKQEIAKARGVELPSETNPNRGYLIGRLVVPLPLDPPPGLDLTEAGSMVLVSSLTKETADATGMQPLDTIVSVSVYSKGKGSGDDDKGDLLYQSKTLATTLENTAQALGEASAHAIEHGVKEIELELNRVIAGYYQ